MPSVQVDEIVVLPERERERERERAHLQSAREGVKRKRSDVKDLPDNVFEKTSAGHFFQIIDYITQYQAHRIKSFGSLAYII